MCECKPSRIRMTMRCAAASLKWLVPSAVMVFMPKCPACVAGYIALFTGIGITLPLATKLHVGVLAACIIILFALTVSVIHRSYTKRSRI